MPRDEEITFADHLGRFYAHRYAFPPMVGRVLGYLLVCEPRDQSIAELSEALLASRSAITGALDVLERLHAIRRSRAAGERMDRVRTDFSSAEARGFDITEYQELGDLAREGLEVLSDARRAGLKTTATIAVAFGCPFEGEVPLERVVAIALRLAEAVPDEVALADTIGVGVPSQVLDAFTALRAALGSTVALRAHFHNTRNTGIANAFAALSTDGQ